jgi:hypothetical protein
MNKRYLAGILTLVASLSLFAGCGILGKRDPLLKLCPYQKPAFYGKVVDKATRERPLYPVSIALLPEDPGNHVVVDSSVFFVDDKGLDPIYEYSLRIGAQYYNSVDVPLKYIRGKVQNLGIIELENIEPKYQGPFKIKPFVEFDPGSGILEKPGWSISSFLSHWKAVDQPFTIEDVEQYVKESLPPGSPQISRDEVKQAIDGWLKDNLITSYGRNSYMLK